MLPSDQTEKLKYQHCIDYKRQYISVTEVNVVILHLKKLGK